MWLREAIVRRYSAKGRGRVSIRTTRLAIPLTLRYKPRRDGQTNQSRFSQWRSRAVDSAPAFGAADVRVPARAGNPAVDQRGAGVRGGLRLSDSAPPRSRWIADRSPRDGRRTEPRRV